jgi:hypothetical protein
VHTGVCWANPRERDLSEDLGIDGSIIIIIIIKWTSRKWGREMGWIELAQDRDRWLAIVNAVMNLRVSSNAGNFFIRGPVSFLGTALLHGVSYSATLSGAHTI